MNKENPNDIFWKAIDENLQIVQRGMMVGMVVLIGSTSLLIFAYEFIFTGFFFAIGISFGTIYFIMNYRAWQVINRMAQKKYIHDNDLAELKRISFRGF